MKSLKVLVLVSIFTVGVIHSGKSDSFTSQTALFDGEKWVGKWVKIWNTYDLNKVDELFLQDDRLTYFSSEKEGAIIGIEKVRDHHEGFGFVPGGKDQPNKLWVEDLYSVDFGSSAVVTGIWYFQRSDGTKQRGPVTIVYIQQGNLFQIAHMNFSNYIDEEK